MKVLSLFDSMNNTCICCGEMIPEGRQICWICERNDDMRLIDADAITADSDLVKTHVSLAKKCKMEHKSGCCASSCEDCFARLFKYYEHLTPTVDAEPVKHGKWETRVQKDATVTGQHTVTECSECGYVLFTSTRSYCAKCGAKMDGEPEQSEK